MGGKESRDGGFISLKCGRWIGAGERGLRGAFWGLGVGIVEEMMIVHTLDITPDIRSAQHGSRAM